MRPPLVRPRGIGEPFLKVERNALGGIRYRSHSRKGPEQVMLEQKSSLILDVDRLGRIADERRNEFSAAEPYPHIVIDEFLEPAVVEALQSEFPAPDAPLAWRRNDTTDQGGQVAQANKLGFSDERMLGPTIRSLFWDLNSGGVLKFLERLTSQKDLVSDPHFFGGGIHQSMPGAVLALHADFQRHPVFPWTRKLNLILFLNSDWDDRWGGHLELWDRQMEHCVHRIAPVANRCVIFRTDKDTYHGHPDPLRCPEGVTRKSMATYYYTAEDPEFGHRGDGEGQSTLWQRRPTDAPMPKWRTGRLATLARKVMYKLRGPSPPSGDIGANEQ
ncbi:MAG: 2OG-Fe(II) oxygenase [Phycisphaera sp. RhM]|nr:2OG-Fe(II) oxygenase [Phycisphaera sp. RhM]